MMSVEQRVRRCLLLEKMKKDPEYSRKLGLEDRTVFKGKRVNILEGDTNKWSVWFLQF